MRMGGGWTLYPQIVKIAGSIGARAPQGMTSQRRKEVTGRVCRTSTSAPIQFEACGNNRAQLDSCVELGEFSGVCSGEKERRS